MTIFEEVKELIDVPTAARQYGIEIRRGNMVLCPFHSERSPSCKLYEKNYHCFSCGEHGDVIGLVQKLFNLSAIDAVKQLNHDFALGLDVDKPPDRSSVIKRQKKIQQAKEQQIKLDKMRDILLGYFVLLDKYKMRYAPKSPDGAWGVNMHSAVETLRREDCRFTPIQNQELDERFVFALHHIEYAWYKLSQLDRSFITKLSDSERKEIYSEVDEIEREYNRILEKWGSGE